MNKFGRLVISPEVLKKYFQLLQNSGENCAFICKGYGGIVFMEYQEDGEKYMTILDRADYNTIKGTLWEGFNGYIVDKKDHKRYLHRVLCNGNINGMIVHHKGHRFDNRRYMLTAVTPKNHDQHRTYFGDMVISMK